MSTLSVAKETPEGEILEDYPELEHADIKTALLYAYQMVAGEAVYQRAAAWKS